MNFTFFIIKSCKNNKEAVALSSTYVQYNLYNNQRLILYIVAFAISSIASLFDNYLEFFLRFFILSNSSIAKVFPFR